MERQYQLTIVAESSDHKKVLEAVKNILKLNKATNVEVADWGSKKLAYKIKNQDNGNYYFITMDLVPSAVNKLQSQLNIENNLLRYLLVTADEKPVEVEEGETKA